MQAEYFWPLIELRLNKMCNSLRNTETNKSSEKSPMKIFIEHYEQKSYLKNISSFIELPHLFLQNAVRAKLFFNTTV